MKTFISCFLDILGYFHVFEFLFRVPYLKKNRVGCINDAAEVEYVKRLVGA